MLKYFNNCKTIEDVKRTYRTLCKENHPDTHEASEFDKYNAIMAEINAEYERAFNRYKNTHESAEDSTKTYESRTETHESAEEFMRIINALIKCDGIEIDIVGRWVWVFGNTYPYKEIIKSLGFRWASKHKKWYYHNPEDACNRHSGLTYEQITEKYGRDIFKGQGAPRLAAQA